MGNRQDSTPETSAHGDTGQLAQCSRVSCSSETKMQCVHASGPNWIETQSARTRNKTGKCRDANPAREPHPPTHTNTTPTPNGHEQEPSGGDWPRPPARPKIRAVALTQTGQNDASRSAWPLRGHSVAPWQTTNPPPEPPPTTHMHKSPEVSRPRPQNDRDATQSSTDNP